MGISSIDTTNNSVTTETERQNAAAQLASAQQKNATNTGLVRNANSVSQANTNAILGRQHGVVAHHSNGRNYIGGSNFDPLQQVAHVGEGQGDIGGDAIARGYDIGKGSIQATSGWVKAVNKGRQTINKARQINKAQSQINKTFGSTSELAKGSNMRKQYHMSKTKGVVKSGASAGAQGVKSAGLNVAERVVEDDDNLKYNAKAAKYGVKGTKKGVKAAKKGVKKLGKKISQRRAAKTARRAAQASKNTARAGAKATKAGAKAGAQGVKVTAKGVSAAGKGIAAGAKGIGAAIAAGGWVPLAIGVVIILLIILLLAVSSLFMREEHSVGSLTGNEAIVAQVLLDRGYNNQNVAAVLGNLWAESGVDPTKCEGGRQVEDLPQSEWTASGGYGLAQWTSTAVGGRRWNVCEYAKGHAGKTGDCQAQAEFLANEMDSGCWTNRSSYYGKNCVSFEEWKGITDIAESTSQYCMCFEGCSSSAYASSIDKRVSKAQEYYELMCQGGGGGDVVSRAYAELGKPYGWGQVGPDSYDCSGLVSYCISGQHTRIGNTGTFMQWPRTDNPQPGDVCTSASHCGIYIGNGQMIHAPQTGDVVKISAVQRNMIYVTVP